MTFAFFKPKPTFVFPGKPTPGRRRAAPRCDRSRRETRVERPQHRSGLSACPPSLTAADPKLFTRSTSSLCRRHKKKKRKKNLLLLAWNRAEPMTPPRRCCRAGRASTCRSRMLQRRCRGGGRTCRLHSWTRLSGQACVEGVRDLYACRSPKGPPRGLVQLEGHDWLILVIVRYISISAPLSRYHTVIIPAVQRTAYRIPAHLGKRLKKRGCLPPRAAFNPPRRASSSSNTAP